MSRWIWSCIRAFLTDTELRARCMARHGECGVHGHDWTADWKCARCGCDESWVPEHASVHRYFVDG